MRMEGTESSGRASAAGIDLKMPDEYARIEDYVRATMRAA